MLMTATAVLVGLFPASAAQGKPGQPQASGLTSEQVSVLHDLLIVRRRQEQRRPRKIQASVERTRMGAERNATERYGLTYVIGSAGYWLVEKEFAPGDAVGRIRQRDLSGPEAVVRQVTAVGSDRPVLRRVRPPEPILRNFEAAAATEQAIEFADWAVELGWEQSPAPHPGPARDAVRFLYAGDAGATFANYLPQIPGDAFTEVSRADDRVVVAWGLEATDEERSKPDNTFLWERHRYEFDRDGARAVSIRSEYATTEQPETLVSETNIAWKDSSPETFGWTKRWGDKVVSTLAIEFGSSTSDEPAAELFTLAFHGIDPAVARFEGNRCPLWSLLGGLTLVAIVSGSLWARQRSAGSRR